MDIETDPYIEEFLDHKPRSSRTVYVYLHAWKKYSEFLNKTPKEFIEEAKEDQISYIRNKDINNENGEKEVLQQIIEPDVEKSNLANYFKEFKKLKESEGVKHKTISNYFSFIRALYSFHNVKLPNPLVLDIETNPKKILKQEKIRRAIIKASQRNKAIIALMASTGFRSRDVRYLKIKDLLKALEIETIEELLLHGQNNIGFWNFKPIKTEKRNIYCQVCNTPYSTDLILDYLKERKKEKEILDPKDYLFVAKNKEIISRNRFISIFKDLNEKLYYDDLEWFKEQLKLGKITQVKYEEEIKDISNFHAHALRAYFINTISSAPINLKICAAMEGHKSPIGTDKNYTGFERKDIEKYYTPLIPFLSFDKTEIRLLTDKRIDEYEKKLENIIKQAEIAEETHKKEINEIEAKYKMNKEELKSFKDDIEEFKDIIEQKKEEKEKEELINAICDDKNLIDILNNIHHEKEDIDIKNINLLREVVRLKEEKDLSKWKEEEIKKAIHEIIDKVKPIDKMRIFTKSFGKSNSVIKNLVGDKVLLENLTKEVFEQMNAPFIKKEKK